MMPNITDWITAIAGVVSAFAIIVLWLQTRQVAKQIELQTQQTHYLAEQLKLESQQTNYLAEQIKVQIQQSKDDHERSRRENAINQQTRLTDRLEQGNSAARRLVEALTVQQTEKLYREEPFTLTADEKHQNWLSACLAQQTHIKFDTNAVQGGQLHLTPAVVSALRWQVVTYLNALEGVMAAWLHNVADREMITEQFGYLIDPGKGYTALKQFRTVGMVGGKDSYPGIAAFVRHLEAKSNQSTNEGRGQGRGPIA